MLAKKKKDLFALLLSGWKEGSSLLPHSRADNRGRSFTNILFTIKKLLIRELVISLKIPYFVPVMPLYETLLNSGLCSCFIYL